MKKFVLLTSVLALAACAGGTGGNGGNGNIPSAPTTVSADAVRANAEVTGMVSEILVGEDGTSFARMAKGRDIGGKKYDVYNLGDVDFRAADEAFDIEMNFVVNDKTGEIEKILVKTEDDRTLEFNHIGKGVFAGKVEKDGGWSDAHMTYNSLGRKMGLKYSDFGTLGLADTNDQEIEGWQPVFIGGYDKAKGISGDKMIASGAKMTFEGKAVGEVAHIANGKANMRKLDETNATLVFDATGKTATQTLTASFKNWYDIQYTKTGNSAGEVEFTHGDNKSDFSDFYLLNDTDGSGGKLTVTGEDFRYYGDNGNASEAVGIFRTSDCKNGICTNAPNGEDFKNIEEVRMNVAFGGKRK